MFLLQKAKLVSRFEQANKFHKNMFMVVQWGICVMIVGGLVLGGALTHGRLTHGGHCMEVIPSQLVWFILVCNTFMCIALVYLFLQPLRKVAMPGNRNSVNDMAFVFKKNAFISSGAVIGTFIIATTYSVFVQLGESTGVDEYYTIGLSIMVWDVLILCVASRLTTNMWLPRYMTRILRIQNKSQVSETRTTRNDNRASVACFERSRSVAPKRFDQPVETLVQISNIKE